MPLPISKFIRSRLNKTRLHREWKGGIDRDTKAEGAPPRPDACISFDFAMPSIFIPPLAEREGDRGGRAPTIEHNVDCWKRRCQGRSTDGPGSFLSFHLA